MILNEDYEMIFKIVIIGDSGVGKTNLLSQYIRQEFNIDSRATVGVEFGSKVIEINKTKVKAQIWDTAGQERYRSITTSYYKGAKGAFIVYDVTKIATFESVDRWLNEIKSASDQKISIVMVGNKIDLKDIREVTTVEGETKAMNLGIGFIETSAKDYKSVDSAFDIMMKNIIREYKTSNLKRINDDNTKDMFDLSKGEEIRLRGNETKIKKDCNC